MEVLSSWLVHWLVSSSLFPIIHSSNLMTTAPIQPPWKTFILSEVPSITQPAFTKCWSFCRRKASQLCRCPPHPLSPPSLARALAQWSVAGHILSLIGIYLLGLLKIVDSSQGLKADLSGYSPIHLGILWEAYGSPQNGLMGKGYTVCDRAMFHAHPPFLPQTCSGLNCLL